MGLEPGVRVLIVRGGVSFSDAPGELRLGPHYGLLRLHP